MIIKENEFDRNYHDDDFDCCKVCGQCFESFETFYSICNCWDGGDFIICPECIEKIKEEINSLKD